MLRVMPRLTSTPPPSPGPAKYLSVCLSLKILRIFCDVPPLTSQRVKKIVHDDSLSSVVKEQEGLTAAFALQFIVPWLDKELPKLLESKLDGLQRAIDQPIAFPEDFFHEMLEQLSHYYADVIRAYRETAAEPFLTDTVENSVQEKLERFYVKEGRGDEVHFLLDALFTKTFESIPWIFRGTASLFFSFAGYVLRQVLSLPAFSAPDDLASVELCFRIMICRFLNDLKVALKRSSPAAIPINRKLFERYLQNEFLVMRLSACTSQFQVSQVLSDTSTLRWIEDQFLFSEISKITETILGRVWSIVEKSSWRKKEMEHLLQNFENYFEDPNAVLQQPNDIDEAIQELLEEVFKQKLPRYVQCLKEPGAQMAMIGKRMASEKWLAFWLKSHNLRFGLLHRQLLMRYL